VPPPLDPVGETNRRPFWAALSGLGALLLVGGFVADRRQS
jgi:hypothetical protein